MANAESTRDQVARIYTWMIAHPEAVIRSARTTSSRPALMLGEESWDEVSGWQFDDRIGDVAWCDATQYGIDFTIGVTREAVPA